MSGEFAETRAKVKAYYEKVGQLNIDPFDIPESPDEIELYVGWFFDRVRSIVSIENSRRKFGSMSEVLVLLGEAAGDLGLSIKFTYYENIGQHSGQGFAPAQGRRSDADIKAFVENYLKGDQAPTPESLQEQFYFGADPNAWGGAGTRLLEQLNQAKTKYRGL